VVFHHRTRPEPSKARQVVEPVCVLSLFSWFIYFLHIKGGLVGTGFESGFIEGVGLAEGGRSGLSSSTYKSSSSYSSSGGVGCDAASTGFNTLEAKL
jgi:hypothetical protein